MGRTSDGDGYTRIYRVWNPSLTASLFYRERCGSYVDLGLELLYVHRAFDAGYGGGGMMSGYAGDVHAELDQLYLSITPEVRMNASGIRLSALAC